MSRESPRGRDDRPDASSSGAPAQVPVSLRERLQNEGQRAAVAVEWARSIGRDLRAVAADLLTIEERGAQVIARALDDFEAIAGVAARLVLPTALESGEPTADRVPPDAELEITGLAGVPSARDADASLEHHGSRLRIGDAHPLAEAVRTGRGVFCHGRAEILARFPAAADLVWRTGAQSIAAVPVAAFGQTQGVLCLLFAEPHELSASERARLRVFGVQYARALVQSRLYFSERAAREEADAARRDAERARGEADTARAAAEAANAAKAEFLATMSHELRTPLNAIGGYVDLMLLGVPEPAVPAHAEYLLRIRRAQQHLLALVTEVLNFARAEAGRVEYRITTFDLPALFAQVDPLVRPQAQAKHLDYTVDAGGEPLAVVADQGKVAQVLLNVLSNAVKFTPRGGRIVMVAERAPAAGAPAIAGSAGMVAIRVRDTGIGIPADRLGQVFDPFVQIDSRLTREAGGAGLGLAIARDLARGMGGDLVAESAVGVGSTFALTLPIVG